MEGDVPFAMIKGSVGMQTFYSIVNGTLTDADAPSSISDGTRWDVDAPSAIRNGMPTDAGVPFLLVGDVSYCREAHSYPSGNALHTGLVQLFLAH